MGTLSIDSVDHGTARRIVIDDAWAARTPAAVAQRKRARDRQSAIYRDLHDAAEDIFEAEIAERMRRLS
eukprot:10520143-Alexandrium_andersonii.AAC.1